MRLLVRGRCLRVVFDEADDGGCRLRSGILPRWLGPAISIFVMDLLAGQ
jgi:hypothetical protein